MQKRQRGQSLDISARDWNRNVDAHNAHRVGLSGETSRGDNRTDFVFVKNNLGRDLPRFAAVNIGNHVLSSIDQLVGNEDMVFELRNGSLQAQAARIGDPFIGILNEPIANGRVGRAQVSGVTYARFRYNDVSASTYGAPFGVLADRDDMLAFSTFGPVKVLDQYWGVGASANTHVWPVQIVQSQSLGVCRALFPYELASAFTWNAAPDFAYAGSYSFYGDIAHVGWYGLNPGGTPPFQCPPAMLGRNGTYLVRLEWSATINSTITNQNDRIEYRVNWADGNQYGSFTPRAFAGGPVSGYSETIRGQREFTFLIDAVNPATPIPHPGFEARVVNAATGVGTALAPTGQMIIDVVRLGHWDNYDWSYWWKALKDSAWARGTTAGPI